jgi:hypothetical protein
MRFAGIANLRLAFPVFFGRIVMNKSAVKVKVAKKDPGFDKVLLGQGGPHARPPRTHTDVVASFPVPGPQDCSNTIGFRPQGVISGNPSDILDIQVSLVVGTQKHQMRVAAGGPATITTNNTGAPSWNYQFPPGTFPQSGDTNLPAILIVQTRTVQGGTMTLYVPFCQYP